MSEHKQSLHCTRAHKLCKGAIALMPQGIHCTHAQIVCKRLGRRRDQEDRESGPFCIAHMPHHLAWLRYGCCIFV
jgi:hypothetical protein